MAGRIAIDFGASTTKVAVARDAEPARLVPFEAADGALSLPTVVYVPPEGDLEVGASAEARAVRSPRRVVTDLKRRVARRDGLPPAEQVVVVGAGERAAPVPLVRLVAAVLAAAHDAGRAALGGQPATVVCTHPVDWSSEQREALAAAAAMAGIGAVEFVSEPVAAGLWAIGGFGDGSSDGEAPVEALAVFDLGAHSFDAAVLRRNGRSWETAGSAGQVVGGDDFDAALLGLVLEGLDDADQADAAAEWIEIRTFAARREARRAKERLTEDTEVVFPLEVVGRDVTVRRDLFAAAIDEHVARCEAVLAQLVRSVPVGAVVLSGGSSIVPAVAGRVAAMADELGARVVSAGDGVPPTGLVALGATRHEAGEPEAKATTRAPRKKPTAERPTFVLAGTDTFPKPCSELTALGDSTIAIVFGAERDAVILNTETGGRAVLPTGTTMSYGWTVVGAGPKRLWTGTDNGVIEVWDRAGGQWRATPVGGSVRWFGSARDLGIVDIAPLGDRVMVARANGDLLSFVHQHDRWNPAWTLKEPGVRRLVPAGTKGAWAVASGKLAWVPLEGPNVYFDDPAEDVAVTTLMRKVFVAVAHPAGGQVRAGKQVAWRTAPASRVAATGAFGGLAAFTGPDDGGPVRLHDLTTGEPLATLPAPPGTVHSLVFSPSGRRLYAAAMSHLSVYAPERAR